ncbi:nuclear transport factor 2 family protein [Polaribacter batillariae]|uniref:Nuclear transport factor 2 family protein n=1 Tax=Polaribacter batillariae TaxID=2808900 RepID=A0ABX7T0G8_9FLAO|nr:nuclear transport factor 2 family protein [Polaribacter batillariae]QTD38761.1 nuclear transport factor 2 family protein [Polaribacter batillariae]
MKNTILVSLFFILIIACNSSKIKKPVDQTKIKNKINTILTNWHKAAATANFDNYFGALDSVSIYIGTAAEENWTKAQFANFSKPYFDSGKAWSFTALERNIYVNKTGNFVWFDELLNTWMGTCRGSGVLEKTGDSWKIKHYVLSVTIPNNDIQKVIKAKKKNDSIFLKNFKQ